MSVSHPFHLRRSLTTLDHINDWFFAPAIKHPPNFTHLPSNGFNGNFISHNFLSSNRFSTNTLTTISHLIWVITMRNNYFPIKIVVFLKLFCSLLFLWNVFEDCDFPPVQLQSLYVSILTLLVFSTFSLKNSSRNL